MGRRVKVFFVFEGDMPEVSAEDRTVDCRIEVAPFFLDFNGLSGQKFVLR